MIETNQKIEDMLKSAQSFIPRRIANSAEPGNSYFEGIVFCADVSGFTAMSEKLLTSGKEGSEEISKIINSFFNPLIKIIDKYGGDIFFFGGDAITAVFGKDQNYQALEASVKAVEFVNKSSKVKTSQGIFNISIHIALTKGYMFYNQTKCLFMLAGNTCYRVIKLLDYAKKQEIVFDNVIRKNTSEIEYDEIKRGVYRLKSIEKSNVMHNRSKLNKIPLIKQRQEMKRLLLYLPGWLERRIEIKQTFNSKDGEHRNAAVVFIHFRNIPFDRDAQKINTIADNISFSLDKLSEKYGGWVNKIDFYKDGIRALIIFGFPTKLENDERHAIMFAREMLAEKKLADIDLRIGINSGLIYGTPIGSNIRREYTVMGDTVNTAARITAKAGTREITVGENVYRKTVHLFDFKKTRGKVFKGKTGKISNYIFEKQVEKIASKSNVGQWISESKKLIGHKDEIQRFKDAIISVKKKNGRIIAFTGEAGLGKSRVIGELKNIAEKNGLNIFEGNCVSYGKALSYYPWIEILSKIFELNNDDSQTVKRNKIKKVMNKMGKGINTWLPLVGEVLGIDFPMNDIVRNLDSKIKKQKFFDIVFNIIVKYSSKKPICIIMEDVHWADSISMELLNYIIRNIEEQKVLFLLAYRPIKEKLEFMVKKNCTEFIMKELSENETLELVENLLKIKQLPKTLKTLLVKKSQGNPFYIEEIIKSMIEQGYIFYEKKKWRFSGNIEDIKLPDSVEGVILSRIDRMDLIERDVVQIASVLGREFDAYVLKGIYTDEKQLDKSLKILRSLDLLKIDENKNRYIFKHILTCETAYNTLSFERKRELHQHVAKFIERIHKNNIDEHLGILSYHYYLSRNYEKSLQYSVKAGDKAKNVYANDEAIEFYTRAIESYEKLNIK